jgi:hypothetical protein
MYCDSVKELIEDLKAAKFVALEALACPSSGLTATFSPAGRRDSFEGR